jgi:hypothetical protein
MPVIGYYVHHHGSGHRKRFDAVAPRLGETVAISELEIGDGLRLPSDAPCAPVDPHASGALHWAPLHRGASHRLRLLTEWLDVHDPLGVVVDVSVEAAVACRLAGVATIVIRQHGHRCDRPHQLGYEVASRLIAPWPEELDRSPRWIREKTDHVGYVTDDSGHGTEPDRRAEPLNVDASDVVVLWGRGGGRLAAATLNSIARGCHGTVWCVGTDVVGDVGSTGLAPNVVIAGWRDDVDSILQNSPVVIASAGDNTIAAVARRGCPLVLLPQRRPFAEQHAHAHALAELGAAVVVDEPSTERAWRDRLDQALACSDHLAGLYASGGAQRFADAVCATFGAARS